MFKKENWIFIAVALFFVACSPRVRTTKPNESKKEDKEKTADKKTIKKFSRANVSLLVPFRLDQLNLKTAGKSEIEKYAMPIDFYQGFKLGLDSVAESGLTFNLNVFDTQDDNAHIASLYKNERFKQSNLIVGPVFPEGLKYIAPYAKESDQLIVSPLAASEPSEFNNPNLISIVNNITLHSQRIVAYITRNYNPENTIVVLINPKKTEDEQFAAPVRSYFLSQSKFTFQEYASAFTFETKMIKGKSYVVVLASSDRAFVSPTIDKLFKIKSNYNLSLFGHPNWIKQNYPTDKLQALNTIITSSYKIDYKNSGTISFIKRYRKRYGFEPGEYAFKGFDIGYYFGKLLSTYGEDYRDHLTKEKYKGLHNNFTFIYDEKLGYINTSLWLLKYKNFALEIVQ